MDKLIFFAGLYFVAGSLLAIDPAGAAFTIGTQGNVPKDRIRVTRTCDIGPSTMNVAVCPGDDACPEMGRLKAGQSQDFAVDARSWQEYSVKGPDFYAGAIFMPCWAYKGQQVEIMKKTVPGWNFDVCNCETK
ncbi:MAG TPA: hypothetical protein VEL47_01795 [Myxococcota bacterium]|nr:hypothetical protein [Myxococcota bacterium]